MKKTYVVRWTALALCLMLMASSAFAAPSDWTVPMPDAISQNVRPQDDFNAYINSEWVQNAVLPAGYSTLNVFSELSFLTRDQVLELLKNGGAASHEAALAQGYYRMMVDMDKRNADGTDALLKAIEQIEAISTIEELTACLLAPDCTDSLLLGFGSMLDFADSTLYVAVTSNDSFLLSDPAEYVQRTAMGDRLEEGNLYLIGKMYAHMGRTQEEGEAVCRAALTLEAQLAPYAYSTADTYSPDYFQKIYNVYQPEELQELNHVFPFMQMLEAKGYQHSPYYIVFNPGYHAACDEIYTQQNLESLKALLICKRIMSAASLLDQKSLDICNEANVIASGAEGNLPLEEIAYANVSSILPGAVGRMYVENHFSEETRQDILAMVDQIIAVYRTRLQNADWLSPATREKAIAKLDAMTVRVGYGEKWKDYSALQIDPEESFYEAILSYTLYMQQDNAALAGTRVDRDLWDSPSHDVNAFYNPQDHSINILAGILSPPFYTPGGSVEANLGGIGTVIGHEITHAFDASGSQFDADGNMVSWWTEADHAAFSERCGKVAQYFSTAQPLPGLYVNGVMSQGEAVADLGGVSAALEIASTMEGFDYQAFFEAYASLWAVLCTPEALELQVRTDPHPPGYLRCNITLQQFEEFYDAYGIAEGDGMYLAPEERLSVW